jgi:aminoglycoside phosphotransferase (APT) family kinase protein
LSSSAPDSELLRARASFLSRALSACSSGNISVQSMHLAPGGNSRETWICEVNQGGPNYRVVFRCDPDQLIRPAEMKREINGLKLAERAGVPAPKVLTSSEDNDLGRPYVVTEFVEGTAIARQIIREDKYAAARGQFARQCGDILARLHGAAAHAGALEPFDPIDDLEMHLANAAYPSPVLQGAIRWLARHRAPASHREGPVHRDFRLGNLMISEAGIVAVLDWETCLIGDPDEDIGWLCSRSWRYGSELPVGGLGSMEDFLDAYQRRAGRTVDADRLHWWSVYAETRWGLASIARQRPGSAGDIMEQAAITRRACRQEYNVLLELKADLITCQ